jgi:hypothetical protein
LIVPSDATLKKVDDLLYSGDGSKASKARDILNAHILRDAYKVSGDFVNGTVSNSLFPSQDVSVGRTPALTLSGAEIEVDKDFIDSSVRGLAVWKVKSGEIPVTTDKPAKAKKAAPRKGASGGYVPTPTQADGARFKMAVRVENEYAMEMLSRAGGAPASRDVYCEYVHGLLEYLQQADKETLFKVLPLVSHTIIDFYLLVEPHNFSGSYLISDDLISGWNCKKSSKSVKDIQAMLDLPDAPDCAVYKKRDDLHAAIAKVRAEKISQVNGDPRNAIKSAIAPLYQELSSKNTIDGVSRVLPAELAEVYQAEPGRKMLEDDLRFWLHCAQTNLQKYISAHKTTMVSDLNNLFNMLGDSMYRDSESKGQYKLLNEAQMAKGIAPTERMNMIQIFVNSDMFLFMPSGLGDESQHDFTKSSMPRPDEDVFYSTLFEVQKMHQRIAESK